MSTIHLCLFSFSLFLSETTSTGRGIRFWAWPDWPRMSWQRFPTSCCLTWKVEASSPGRLCLPPLSLPRCLPAPRPAALPRRNARRSPRRWKLEISSLFFFLAERDTSPSPCACMCAWVLYVLHRGVGGGVGVGVSNKLKGTPARGEFIPFRRIAAAAQAGLEGKESAASHKFKGSSPLSHQLSGPRFHMSDRHLCGPPVHPTSVSKMPWLLTLMHTSAVIRVLSTGVAWDQCLDTFFFILRAF